MSENDHSPDGFVRVIELPQIHDPRGDLTFVEGGSHIPFDIARVGSTTFTTCRWMPNAAAMPTRNWSRSSSPFQAVSA